MTDRTPTQRVEDAVVTVGMATRHYIRAELARQLAADLEAAQRALAERNAVVDNLATMLRRMIWMANKLDGDVGIKVTAGKAKELLAEYGLRGNPLRDGPASPAPDALVEEIAREACDRAGYMITEAPVRAIKWAMRELERRRAK